MVQDMQNSIEYYRTILNFELVQSIPDTEPFDWVSMKCDGIEIALQDQALMRFDIPEMQELKTGSTILFYLDVDDVDRLYDKVKDKVEISQEICTFYPGFREFRIRDCNGYFWTLVGNI